MERSTVRTISLLLVQRDVWSSTLYVPSTLPVVYCGLSIEKEVQYYSVTECGSMSNTWVGGGKIRSDITDIETLM